MLEWWGILEWCPLMCHLSFVQCPFVPLLSSDSLVLSLTADISFFSQVLDLFPKRKFLSQDCFPYSCCAVTCCNPMSWCIGRLSGHKLGQGNSTKLYPQYLLATEKRSRTPEIKALIKTCASGKWQGLGRLDITIHTLLLKFPWLQFTLHALHPSKEISQP